MDFFIRSARTSYNAFTLRSDMYSAETCSDALQRVSAALFGKVNEHKKDAMLSHCVLVPFARVARSCRAKTTLTCAVTHRVLQQRNQSLCTRFDR